MSKNTMHKNMLNNIYTKDIMTNTPKKGHDIFFRKIIGI